MYSKKLLVYSKRLVIYSKKLLVYSKRLVIYSKKLLAYSKRLVMYSKKYLAFFLQTLARGRNQISTGALKPVSYSLLFGKPSSNRLFA